MAEVIGLVASIAGITQLTAKLVAVSHGYIGGVNRARKDVRELMDELRSLTNIIIVSEDNASSNPGSTALQTLDELPQKYLSELKELLLELEPRGRIDCLKWPLKEKETLQRISRIERFKGLFNLAITADTGTVTKSIEGHVIKTGSVVLDIKADLQGTNTTIHEIEAVIQNTNTAIRDESMVQRTHREKEEIRLDAEKRETVLEWLYSDDFTTAHIDISKRRQIGTGNWLMESPEFRDWAEGRPNFHLLWGPGIPGAGKTFLCSAVIDNFMAQELKKNYGLAYIYFNYKESEQQTPIRIISSLLKQLSRRIPQLLGIIEDLYGISRKEGRRPTIGELYDTLIKVSVSFPRVFFIFDALDECKPEARAELLPLFQRMANGNISVFLTSRPHPEDIQNSFSSAVKIELSAQSDDVVTYVRERIGNDKRIQNHIRKARCEDRIISELVDCAQGMFLLVRFHMDFLCQQINAKQLLKALDQIKDASTGKQQLDATYERAMENIRRQDQGSIDLAFGILSWLVKAKRTLTVEELQIAMAVEPGRYELDELNITEKTTLIDVCASLVIIDEMSGTVKLAHYTVQEYLQKLTGSLNADFRVAMACTTYLTFDAFADGPCSSHELMLKRLKLHPFLDYAAKFFHAHLQAYYEDLTTELLLKFFNNLSCVDSYQQAKQYNLHYSQIYMNYENETPLHIASRLGHSTVVCWLLEKGANVRGVTKSNETPLLAAAEGGHETVVKLLLESGAISDISTPDKRGRTPLFAAAAKGHEKVVRLLLESGAISDISNPDHSGRTPLFPTAEEGHEKLVRLLLVGCAKSNIRTLACFRTPLLAAGEEGDKTVAKFLLEGGAIPDISILDTIKSVRISVLSKLQPLMGHSEIAL